MLPEDVFHSFVPVLNDYVHKAERFVTLWLGYFHRSVERSGNLLLDWMNTSISATVLTITIYGTIIVMIIIISIYHNIITTNKH